MSANDWKEVIPAGEAELFERLARELVELQHGHARSGQLARGLHAKGLPGLEAEFTVLSDLPAEARAGLFATPATYRAYVRFSNGAGRRQPDDTPDVRGIGVKLVGVGGRKVIPGLEDAKTQDFLAIRTPAVPFRDAEEFVWTVRAGQQPALVPFRAMARFGPLKGLAYVRSILAWMGAAIPTVSTTNYYSAAAIRLGAAAVRYTFVAHAKADGARPARGRDRLAEDLRARIRSAPITWDFKVQFFQDEKRTPIEDSSVEWKESDAPFVTLGRLTIPQQDPDSPRGRKLAEAIEAWSFDPWHAQEELRPLGNVMRARNVAYRLSTQARGAAPEPDGSETFA